MKYVLILSFLANGEPMLFTKPVESVEDCSSYMQTFVDARPELKFEAICLNVLDTLAIGTPRREASNHG